MSTTISPRDAKGQTPQNRPPLPIGCSNLHPSISLCDIPRTWRAREVWQDILETVRADLEKQAKLLWWSVAILLIPGGRLAYSERGHGSVGLSSDKVVEEGHFGPWMSCLAACHACEQAIECQWLTSQHSADLEPADLELFESTVARLVMFGIHWREGLRRPPHGQANHNAWCDACYGTPNPTLAQMVPMPAVLTVLEKIPLDIRAPREGYDTMTPDALEAAKIKLPPNWMLWENFVFTSYHIQNNLIDNLRPFADGLHNIA